MELRLILTILLVVSNKEEQRREVKYRLDEGREGCFKNEKMVKKVED